MSGANAVSLLLACNAENIPMTERTALEKIVNLLIYRYFDPDGVLDQIDGDAVEAQRHKERSLGQTTCVSTTPAGQYDKLSLPQLKAKCHAHGLLTSGSRDELRDRLARAQQRGLLEVEPKPLAVPRTSTIPGRARENDDSSSRCGNPPPAAVRGVRITMAQFATRQVSEASSRPTVSTQQQTVVIAVDKRERARVGGGGLLQARSAFVDILESAAENITQRCCTLKVLSHTLPCGDFAVLLPIDDAVSPSVVNDSTSESNPLKVFRYAPLIVERKTFNDLLGSVVSSHLAEQKELMKKVPTFNGVAVLIIEGSAPEWGKLRSEERQRILSSSVTASLVDRFRVVWTRSTVETAAFVVQLAQESYEQHIKKLNHLRAAQQTDAKRISEECCELTDAAIQSLRHELQQNSMALRMLSCAQGISSATARCILECLDSSAVVGGGPCATAAPQPPPLVKEATRGSTMMNVWRLSKHIGGGACGGGDGGVERNLNVREKQVDRHDEEREKQYFDRVVDQLQRSAIDTNSKKRSFALLTHFLSSDAY
ncbi:DNA repair protein, putative [Bodo saltans]|uniref:Crossover junction endonuclease MUS81 n=1 Tax=Bodo saltans TaxID=75058 RepID=A0A0S4JS29_BODSA|nr:DNA repair protein, putative [Bodo saltans]|eukprot:CUG91893.1 DNA repair protein, putative [Bodo saltans]